VTATSTYNSDAGLGLLLGAVRRPPVPRVQRAVVMVLGERPQQDARMAGGAQRVLGVAQQQAVHVVAVRAVLVQEVGVDVQDADLPFVNAHDAGQRAVAVLGQPRLPRPHAVPQRDPVLERRHVRRVDEALVLVAPGAHLQRRDRVHVARRDGPDGQVVLHATSSLR
jgi:hypothetical protein